MRGAGRGHSVEMSWVLLGAGRKGGGAGEARGGGIARGSQRSLMALVRSLGGILIVIGSQGRV